MESGPFKLDSCEDASYLHHHAAWRRVSAPPHRAQSQAQQAFKTLEASLIVEPNVRRQQSTRRRRKTLTAGSRSVHPLQLSMKSMSTMQLLCSLSQRCRYSNSFHGLTYRVVNLDCNRVFCAAREAELRKSELPLARK